MYISGGNPKRNREAKIKNLRALCPYRYIIMFHFICQSTLFMFFLGGLLFFFSFRLVGALVLLSFQKTL